MTNYEVHSKIHYSLLRHTSSHMYKTFSMHTNNSFFKSQKKNCPNLYIQPHEHAHHSWDNELPTNVWKRLKYAQKGTPTSSGSGEAFILRFWQYFNCECTAFKNTSKSLIMTLDNPHVTEFKSPLHPRRCPQNRQVYITCISPILVPT